LKYDILTQNIFMKELVMKLSKSVVAILALSAISFAGGKITPEPAYHDADIKAAEQVVVEQPKVVEEKVISVEVAPVVAAAMGGYVGLAGSNIVERDNKRPNPLDFSSDEQARVGGLTAVAGYDIIENLGAEVRGTKAYWNMDAGDKFKSYGAYLKPQVDLAGVNLYGLAGYAKTKVGADNEEGDVSYGLGLDIPVVENVKVFVDAVQLLDEPTSNVANANAGIKIQF
jgi:hypothetical protein